MLHPKQDTYITPIFSRLRDHMEEETGVYKGQRQWVTTGKWFSGHSRTSGL